MFSDAKLARILVLPNVLASFLVLLTLFKAQTMNIRERVLLVAESKGVKISVLEKQLNVSRSYFRNTKSVSAEAVARLLALYTDINPDWLLNGKGSMLRSESEQQESKDISDLLAVEIKRRLDAMR